MKVFRNLLCIIILLVEVISELRIMRKLNVDYFTPTYRVLMHILKFCKKDDVTVLIFSDSKKRNLKWLENLPPEYTIIQHDNLNNYNSTIQYIKLLDAIVFMIQSTENLKNMTNTLSEMVQWDVKIPTVYVLNTQQFNGCKMSEFALRKVWQYNFLNSYFLCAEKLHQELYIYTYNPFTNRAPNLWKRINEKTSTGNRWMLFRRKYIKENICQDFYFDRTKLLDGYEIIVTCWPKDTTSPTIGKFYNHSFFIQDEELCSDIRKTMDAIASGLNVTFKIYIQSYNWKNKKKYSESLNLLKSEIYQNSSADLIFIRERLTQQNSPLHLTKTDPVDWSELGVVTYNRGYQTFAEKILHFYGSWILSFTFLILLITFFVIWIIEHRKIGFAAFEIIRLIISQSLYTKMDTLSIRIFFCMIFIYFLVIQATFNGHLAKFLTKPQLRKQVDTLEDLQDLGYTSVYNTTSMETLLQKSSKKKPTTNTLINTCFAYIINNDSSAACISKYLTLLKNVRYKNQLYISKNSFGTHYAHFTIRKRWPLSKRLNKVFAQLEESGIRRLWSKNLHHFYTKKDKQIKAKSEQKIRPIKIENITFMFIILGIGLTGGVLSFCVEIYIYRLSNRVLIEEESSISLKRYF